MRRERFSGSAKGTAGKNIPVNGREAALLVLLQIWEELAYTAIALNRVFNYRSVMQDNIEGTTMNVYLRYHLRTDKKNKLLLTVPSMYVLARKNNREFVGETYRKVKFLDVQEYDATLQVAVGTVPRYKFTMPTVRLYLTPKLYDVTLIGDHLLSPFHFRNRSFYRYGVTLLTDQRVEIVFRPRKYNTQLVSGKAIADFTTGRIISVELSGEYDMIRFQLQAEMGDSGELSLVPKSCDVNCVFKYLGNKITGDFHTEANQLVELPDSIVNSHSMALMDSIRPVPLPSFMQSIYHQYDSLDALTVPTTKKKKKNMAKAILWDAVGDNLVNRIKGTFGTNDQGYYRISPILNPLYLGYSDRKGIYYKMKLNGSYAFTENQLLSLNARLGYRFKFHEFYFSVPLRYTYDKEKHGYVELEVGRGNKITSSNIRQQLKEEFPDLTDWNLNQSRLDDFRDSYVKMRANHDISDLWSITAGYTYHRRTAVDKQFFRSINMPVAYHSMAPMIQTQIRPWGWNGPIFTLNYEQGIKGIGKANMEYRMANGMGEMMDAVKAAGGNEGDMWYAGVSFTYSWSDPQDLIDNIDYIFHTHAKFYDVQEDYKETAVAIPEDVEAYKKAGYKGFLSSEYEGGEHLRDVGVDSIEQCRRHQEALRRAIEG